MTDMPPPPPGGATPPPPPGFGSPPGAPTYGAPGAAPGYGAPGAGAPGYGAPGAMPPGYQAYGMTSGPPPVGFGSRLGGFLLDSLLYGLLALLFVGPAFALGVAAFDDCVSVTRGDTTELICPPGAPDGALLGGAIALGVIGYLIVAFIYVRALGRTGQTWGRKIVGIKVVGTSTGQPIGFGRALGRSLFAGFISGQVCYLGYLWMLWDSKKQTWHDKVVSSTVVKA